MNGVRNRRQLRALLSSMCLMVSLAPSLGAQQDTSVIRVAGVVGDAQSGAPIANAVVSIPELRMRTVTDANGRFALEHVPRGEHRWRFRMLGYADWEEALALEDAEFLRVGLLPQPIALENITVTVDRLQQRRKAIPLSVYAVGWDEIRSAVGGSAADVIASRSPSVAVGCPIAGPIARGPRAANHPARSAPVRQRAPLGGADAGVGYCIRWRGQIVSPAIYIDDQLHAVSMDVVTSYLPEEIYSIEFFNFGRHIRIYTIDFVRSGKPLLSPSVLIRQMR